MTSLEPLLTTEEVAEAARVDPETVRRWRRAGALASIRLPGGEYRFRRSDIEHLLSATTADPSTRAAS